MPFWFALVYLRPQPEDALSLLAIMGLVWVADIGAYFCGKSFGKRKIAPTISPGKSWEGAIGGALCECVDHDKASHDDDGSHDSNPYPSVV